MFRILRHKSLAFRVSQGSVKSLFAFWMGGAVTTVATPLKDFTSITYDSKTFAITATATGVCMTEDGTRCFHCNFAGTIYEADGTAGDISTFTATGETYNNSANQAQARGLTISPDGTKLYMIGSNPDRISTITLTTANTLADGVDSVVNEATLGIPQGGHFNGDGSSFFWIDNTADHLYEIPATDYDSITFTGWSRILISSYNLDIEDAMWVNGGDDIIFLGNDGDKILEYPTSTSYDKDNIGTKTGEASLTAANANPLNFHYDATNSKLYVVDSSDNLIYQYSVPDR